MKRNCRAALLHLARSRLLTHREIGSDEQWLQGVASAPLTLIVGIAASSAVLVTVAIADTLREGDTASTRLA